MKGNYLRLIIIISIIFISLLANAFFNLFNANIFILFLGLACIGSYFFIGYEKNRESYIKDIILLIIIYSSSYLIITYLLGIFVGFNLSGYNLTLINILRHIIPVTLIIILSEFLRYLLVSKGRIYLSIIILTICIFTFIDLSLHLRTVDFNNTAHIVEFIITVLFPSIAKNFLLVYLVSKVGLLPAIIYRLIFELPFYFMPIFPAFGLYLDTVLKIIFPLFLVLMLSRSFKQIEKEKIVSRVNNKVSVIISIFIGILLAATVYLVSGMFKYYALTIGSGSMSPSINKGDVVIVKKTNPEETRLIKEDDVLVFNHSDKKVVHRVVRIIEQNERLYFYTKGDNNHEEDGWAITEGSVIGITTIRIPLIGWPTVILSEMIHN